MDAVESDEGVLGKFAGKFVFGAAQVDLGDFIAGYGAGVLDVELDHDAAFGCGLGLEVGIGEGGVAEAEAEGELRLDFLQVEPAIAYIDAFAEGGFAVYSL